MTFQTGEGAEWIWSLKIRIQTPQELIYLLGQSFPPRKFSICPAFTNIGEVSER